MTEHTVLPDMAERAAAAAPDHPATIMGEERLNYSAFHCLTLQAVAALRSAGIGKGDRVGYLGLNSIDYAILFQAALRMGAVTTAINWRLAAREVAYIASDAGLSLMLAEQQFAPLSPEGVPLILLDADRQTQPRFRAWIEGFEPDDRIADLAPGAAAVQLYTSGTTGHPKGAVLTHGCLTAALRQGKVIDEDWAQTDETDVSLVAMPQFHIAGTGWIMASLNAGATSVILGKPDIDLFIETVERERVTRLFAVPAVLLMILNHPLAATADLSSVRVVGYGASPIPLDVLKRSMKLFPNAQFVQMYGATETSGTIVYLPPEDHSVEGNARMRGCGKPYPEVEIRIADAEGNALPAGEVGEVLVKSPLVMGGYHNLPEATADAFVDGWYRTGDAAYLDEDGYLYLYDRVKDMIVSGGENIYPAEVENALHEHEQVRDCAVIGVPDATWGEAVKAIVVRAPGCDVDDERLIAFARERIGGFKVPKSVDFVDELPRNPSGKILKKELRKPFWPEGERKIG